MMHYINIDKKRLCGRNNQTVPPILFDAATEEPLQLQFITSNNQIVHLNPDELSGLYLAGNTKAAEPAYDLLFLSKDYTIENDVLTFAYSTYTKNFLRKITKRNQEILIEIGQIALEKKTLLLRDYALANPRVYIEGSAPEDVDWSDYFTKTETQELLAQNLSSAQAYADGQDAATLASATAYTDEKIAEIDLSEYVTDEELEAAKAELEGDIALKADESDLQLVSGEVDSLAQDITGKADKADVDIISGTVDGHIADSTIHVTAADKTAWNAKAEVSDIPTDNDQLTNGAGYQTAQDVQNAISGKAETSYVDTELAKKQDKITAENKLDYALLSGEPDLSIYATEADLQIVSGVVDTKLEAPSGGTAGQVLTKTADGAEWADSQGENDGYVNYFKVFCYIIGSGSSGDDFKITKINHDEEPLNLQYSRDAGQTWTQYTWDGINGETLTNFPICGIWFKGNNASFNINASKRYRFVLGNSTKHYKLAGNIMTLLDETGKLDKVPDNCFNMAFYNNAYLDDISELELPADYVGIGGYASMFEGCSRIITIPKLPATHLNRVAYSSMFRNCTSLQKAAHIKSVVALRDTYSDYNSGWQIYSDGDGPLNYMFNGCSSLSSVEVDFESWLTYTAFATGGGSKVMTVSWLDNVAASGQFICPYNLPITRDASHIPVGWEIVYKEVPESIVNQAAAVENLIMNND